MLSPIPRTDHQHVARGRSWPNTGDKVGPICRRLGMSEQSYYRLRREYGGMKVDQNQRLNDLESENARLRKAMSDLTLEKLILKEAVEENY